VFDFEMMCRVYRNLLSNALKLSNSGTKIEVEVEIVEKDNIVRVSVKDQGPGIPEAELNSIFDKFVQAGAGKTRGGTGLGLAVCREIINAHDGCIWAENRKEGGACFLFEIPLDFSGEKKDERKK